MNKEDLKYLIAILLAPQIGSGITKNLIAYCGSPKAAYHADKKTLLKIPGIAESTANHIINKQTLDRAEEEIDFINKNNIKALFINDKEYPFKLKQCNDAPILLFYKGDTPLNHDKIVGIVGTRAATDYGKQLCEQLVADLKPFNPLIISGLAFGIDITAHKAAIKHNIPTIGILGHGLDKIYPAVHTEYAKKMIEQGGGIISEFFIKSKPDRENFPKRNRIIAGMCDVVIVVEAKENGGALITANIANSYNRDVFAFPGRIGDEKSIGCNKLIKSHKAALIESAKDIEYIMRWEKSTKANMPKQKSLNLNLSKNELAIIRFIETKQPVQFDDLINTIPIPFSKLSEILLNLEFMNIIKSLPGKRYRLV